MAEQARVIRKRIKSVSSTKKITRTMEMVAGAKLRQAQARVQSSGPYMEQLQALMREIGGGGIDFTRWPLFEKREGKRTLLLGFTANRGLCGAFNANLIRLARQTYEECLSSGQEVLLHMAGKKGITAFRFQGVPLAATYIEELKDKPQPEDAQFFLNAVLRPFLDREVDEVLIVYPHWINSARQPPTLLRLLPIAPEEAAPVSDVPPLFEPSPEAILEKLLPLYLRQTIYSVLAEAVASEQLARRMAMKLATDNAEEMVTNLTREYNKARQALITKELAEILGGAEALK
jgi:F-type H+-transporting ATPase subunit gamma